MNKKNPSIFPKVEQDSARIVAQECFWGDYLIDSVTILNRLEKNDAAFSRFLFSKIVENSRYPSHHLRVLFSKDILLGLLKDYSNRCRNKKRFAIIQSNITHDYSEIPELQWKR